MSNILRSAYERLLAAFGPQHWWPGDSPWEVMVGAVLTQNTSWANVERALENLRDADALDLHALRELVVEEISELIRPAGYYRLKAKRLKNLVDMIHERYDGSLESLFCESTDSLREQLLQVNGVGPETADSIVLYAAEKPSFVVDAYTARVTKRHGWIEAEAGYYDIQQRFHDDLEQDVALFNEYHALLVRVGKDYCKPKPKCEGCPLAEMLPETGIVEC